MEQPHSYGYINGGGPAPGGKAVLAGAATVLKKAGHRLLAIPRGWEGMTVRQNPDEIIDVTAWSRERLQQLIPELGMPVETSRTKIDPVMHPEKLAEVQAMAHHYGIEGLIANGGDDTMTTAAALSKADFPVIGVAKTIDCDVAIEGWPEGDTWLHQTYGWETACETAMKRLQLLRTQARSTGRVAIGEPMGRRAGLITLIAGKAAGADITLIREIPIPKELLFERVRYLMERQGNVVIAVAEGYIHDRKDAEDHAKADPSGHGKLGGISHIIGDDLEKNVRYRRSDGKEVPVKTTRQIIGYDQQVDQPTAMDALRAYRMGAHAGYLAATGKFGRMATMRGDFTTDVELSRVRRGQTVPPELYDPETMSMQDTPWHIEGGRLQVRSLVREADLGETLRALRVQSVHDDPSVSRPI